MGRERDTMGASPAIFAAVAAVSIFTLACGVLGLRSGRTTLEPTTPVLAPQTGVVAQPARLAARSAPARDVVTAILGPKPRWGATIPVPLDCTIIVPVLSAQVGEVTVHVFGAGLGGTVKDQIAACGTRTRIDGTDGTTVRLPDGHLTAWTRGDVLITVAGQTTDPEQPTDLDRRLLTALSGVCTDLAPTAADANRNPNHGGYVQYTQATTVSIDPLTNTPDVGPSAAPLPATEPAHTNLPDGVSGPPLPAPLPIPAPPTWPGTQPMTTQVQIPTMDIAGPGCGWAFTGSVPPATEKQTITDQEAQIITTARAQLVDAQTQWLTAATAYVAGLSTYTTDLAAWTTYTNQVETVTASWEDQAAKLADYQNALTSWQAAVTARDALTAGQDNARKAYETQAAACLLPTPAPTTGPAPTPSVTTTLACPPPRPAILDQVIPPAPTLPAPPALWSPGP